MSSQPIIEIVTFRLKSGADPQQAAQDADAMRAVLEATEGFRSRTLCFGEDGIWTDMIAWDNKEQALRAMPSIMADPVVQPFFSAIDEHSVVMRHDPIHVRI